MYYVSTADHNNESGQYCNDIYAYSPSGSIIDRWCIETKRRTYADVPIDKVIEDVFISDISSSGYDVTIKVMKGSLIGRIAVPVWTVGNATTDFEAQDDLISGWSNNCLATKTDTNTYVYHVDVSDHNYEHGEYCNDIYAYDENGTMIDRWCIETSHRSYATVPKYGDVNADDQFNVSDVVLLQKWLLAVPNIELANWKAADLCEDGVLDVFDLCMMRKMLINLKAD
ncbi:MAG: GBS Bsp-like repeat-containing protein [Ruminococcus sp.]|nr:GBS Bsp-like repeat-containing protein [Ruminococcus sp.]